MWSQELNLVILVGPFYLRIFYDPVKKARSRKEQVWPKCLCVPDLKGESHAVKDSLRGEPGAFFPPRAAHRQQINLRGDEWTFIV